MSHFTLVLISVLLSITCSCIVSTHMLVDTIADHSQEIKILLNKALTDAGKPEDPAFKVKH